MLRFSMRLLSWLLLAFSPSCALALSASSGTVPFVPDGNRVYAQVEFILPEWNPQMSRFDYAGRKMTLAQPATLRMRGTTVPFRLNPKTGLIVIERQSADGPSNHDPVSAPELTGVACGGYCFSRQKIYCQYG
jgi:hypothetical protein